MLIINNFATLGKKIILIYNRILLINSRFEGFVFIFSLITNIILGFYLSIKLYLNTLSETNVIHNLILKQKFKYNYYN